MLLSLWSHCLGSVSCELATIYAYVGQFGFGHQEQDLGVRFGR